MATIAIIFTVANTAAYTCVIYTSPVGTRVGGHHTTAPSFVQRMRASCRVPLLLGYTGALRSMGAANLSPGFRIDGNADRQIRRMNISYQHWIERDG